MWRAFIFLDELRHFLQFPKTTHMLDQALLQQVRSIFAELNAQFTLALHTDSANPHTAEFKAFFSDFASTSDHLHLEEHEAAGISK